MYVLSPPSTVAPSGAVRAATPALLRVLYIVSRLVSAPSSTSVPEPSCSSNGLRKPPCLLVVSSVCQEKPRIR